MSPEKVVYDYMPKKGEKAFERVHLAKIIHNVTGIGINECRTLAALFAIAMRNCLIEHEELNLRGICKMKIVERDHDRYALPIDGGPPVKWPRRRLSVYHSRTLICRLNNIKMSRDK